jgi:hypothetical protein
MADNQIKTYPSLCMGCITRAHSMLTGYCLTSCKCDGCGRVSDLAMCSLLVPVALFKIGQEVMDRDGFRGTVMKVTHWEGSVWYDVRFGRSGEAVRYNSDLEPFNSAST